jgi:glutathione synthase
MPSVCLLISTDGAPQNDNAVRLARAWEAAGWRVVVADHEAVRLLRDCVTLAPDDRPLESFDLIWLVGLGARASFLDRMQLLQGVPPQRFVNTPLALLMQHAKHQLLLGPLARHCPETYASSDPRWLAQMVARGGTWIVKPTAASFGREVYRVDAADTNLAAILESLTGHDGSRYCLLQRYLPEVERGESRVLLAAGELIGAYRRRPGTDHRVNLAGSGHAEATRLSANETALAREVARQLQRRGVDFLAVDLAYPWIVELNVANPGGFATIEALTGEDLAPAAVASLIRRFELPAAI